MKYNNWRLNIVRLEKKKLIFHDSKVLDQDQMPFYSLESMKFRQFVLSYAEVPFYAEGPF